MNLQQKLINYIDMVRVRVNLNRFATVHFYFCKREYLKILQSYLSFNVYKLITFDLFYLIELARFLPQNCFKAHTQKQIASGIGIRHTILLSNLNHIINMMMMLQIEYNQFPESV